MITPNHLDVLLHYNCTPARHEREDAPAVQEAIELFIADGILDCIPASKSGYRVTEKGHAWLCAILSVPYPTQAWLDAAGNVIKDPWAQLV